MILITHAFIHGRHHSLGRTMSERNSSRRKQNPKICFKIPIKVNVTK